MCQQYRPMQKTQEFGHQASSLESETHDKTRIIIESLQHSEIWWLWLARSAAAVAASWTLVAVLHESLTFALAFFSRPPAGYVLWRFLPAIFTAGALALADLTGCFFFFGAASLLPPCQHHAFHICGIRSKMTSGQ